MQPRVKLSLRAEAQELSVFLDGLKAVPFKTEEVII
jgi:hypothetical protein